MYIFIEINCWNFDSTFKILCYRNNKYLYIVNFSACASTSLQLINTSTIMMRRSSAMERISKDSSTLSASTSNVNSTVGQHPQQMDCSSTPPKQNFSSAPPVVTRRTRFDHLLRHLYNIMFSLNIIIFLI